MKRRLLYPSLTFAAVLVTHVALWVWRGSQVSRQWVALGETNWWTLYLSQQEYFLGLSYALAGGFTVYALLKFLDNRRAGAEGILGGLTLTGILAVGGCFLIGCCGSPMLAVYLGLFGASFLGFAKPLILLVTLASVVLGIAWVERRTSQSCCSPEDASTERDGSDVQERDTSADTLPT